MPASPNHPPSPCVAICRLDEQDVCTGCYRTLDEIRRWRKMNDSERSLVLKALQSRNGAQKQA